MNLNDEPKIVTCPVCGVVCRNGIFYWSNRKTPTTPEPTTPDDVYSKVCSIAKKHGKDLTECINSTGKYDPTKTWVDLDKELFNQIIEQSIQ